MRLDLDHPAQYTDQLRLDSGVLLTLRFAGPGDGALLQDYFRALSPSSRYSRLMGAAPELPAGQLVRFLQLGEADAYTVLATVANDHGETAVAELRYVHHQDEHAVEFGVSVHDRWQGRGVGAALLANLECRAAALGAELIYGDTLRSNTAMIGLARKAGYQLAASLDWKQTRFVKTLNYTPQTIPCASWRLAALQGERSPRIG
ncbi:GNAT family N-acetyltransferase [Rhodopseudomonas palustris]|uniref:GNAT family N-acetyltransferase n=1 Tax=Rhodopseudomonas palustris TaxID=1076 RepID=A0A418VH40_RHOPL|nr:GNAT family N-acetyltransferase [Rhodopseudomonas palustris]RJF75443.1 GNAT family N-acetyltransferase [Rhodopseudomonas palustris]